MVLRDSFEKTGNLFFRYRGQIPVIIFISLIPVMFFTDYSSYNTSIAKFLILISILLGAIGFLIRIITIGTTPAGTSGRNTKSQVAEKLNTSGIYSIVRHPLYLGNYLMWAGLTLFVLNLWYLLIISLVFWIYYERIMFAEECFLQRKYGHAFTEWAMKVPAFFPSFRHYISFTLQFSFKSVLQREYSGMLAIVFGFTFVDYLRYFLLHKNFLITRPSLYFLIAALIIALVLRTIKHHTTWLDESDRT
jgi:protein-S-isoprenylcysteine O-methyltransferase Ste14